MSFATAPIGMVFSVANGATPKSGEEHLWDGDIPWVTPADLGKNGTVGITSGSRSITREGLDSCGTQIVPTGTIVLSIRAPIGHTAIATVPLCFNQGCRGLIPSKKVLTKFGYWSIIAAKPTLQSEGQGTTFQELGRDKLRSVRIALPDLPTQRAVADFLDRETARIDLLIEKKQRLITLLEEKFDAQLYYAISGGDSNITDYPHLSPSYWSRRSVRSITQSHKQGYYTTEDYTTSGYRLIRITDIGKNGDIFSNKAPYVQDVDSAKPFLLKSGDFVFARTGGAGALGVFMDESEKSVFASYLIRFRFMAICNPIFLKYFFLSRCFQDAVSRDLHGGVLQNLSAENIKQQTIALPPMEEQVEIADRLEQLAVRHEKTRGVITASLERLREYRSALITAAVTGQIDIAKRGKGATAYRQLDAIHAEFTQ